MKKKYAASYISCSLFLAYFFLIDLISSASFDPTSTEKLFDDDEAKACDNKILQFQNPLSENNPLRDENYLRGSNSTKRETPCFEEPNFTIDDIIDTDIWLDQLYIKWNSLIRSSREQIETEEQIKKNEWHKKLTELEEEWEKFYSYISTKKDVWLKKKNDEWNTWIKKMESKWIAYKGHIDNELYDSIERCSPEDNISIVNQLKSNVEQNMIEDLKKWIDKSDHNLYKWIICDWNKWKSNFMLDWSKQQWKLKEDSYWKKFTKPKTRTDPFFFLIKEKYDKWAERNKMEQDQWTDITSKLESKYLTAKHADWEEWKINKREWYGKWISYYIENFVNMRAVCR
ncbi:tryptophan-rich antigen, putative [Plasmodium berghei]|uniref:Tryptophan-rich protein n=2 Tax=Plasmodium berghei TaxID=5821 RepID=A0A509AJW4_PLABA|nr:tryptophan-rich antigen [Plasmodium berghei ANKA]CXI21128.1 tryptophan-rich antigen, putative [Plasmodium berghei]SBW38154.1 tryptophan-rich antigen, putative [Plasmodium berghei]SCL81885.1 tryptophan-rich antigen, putative [Plasmodium berghei]SCL82453.1 tryptophan-rich antigen, putative [Plasmodium berghei]VUC54909.1 tryptophan-rich antigen [Plasmodium berghei ANKA]|eukprot:XP_034420734.1 tryptophan-rich antigen [Plasmodium berghei ANKA]